MQLAQGLSVCEGFCSSYVVCPVSCLSTCVSVVCAFNGRCPGGVPIYPNLFFQEAVAGASILGAMSAGTGLSLPQIPQAVMAAQAPGVITGRCTQMCFLVIHASILVYFLLEIIISCPPTNSFYALKSLTC